MRDVISIAVFSMTLLAAPIMFSVTVKDFRGNIKDLDRRITELEEWQEELSPHIPAVIEEWESWEDKEF